MSNRTADFSLRKRVIAGSFWALVGSGINTVMSFISVPLTLAYLGKERMALWRIAIATLAGVSFLRAGLIPFLKTRMSEAFAGGDTDSFRRYGSTSMFMGVVFAALGLGLAPVMVLLDWSGFFRISEGTAQREAGPLMAVLFALTLWQFAGACVVAVFDARMEVSKPRVARTVGSVIGFGLLLVGISARVSLPWLALMSTAPGSLCLAPLMLQLGRREPELHQFRMREVGAVLLQVLRPAIVCFGISFASIATTWIPQYAIVQYIKLEDVTVFSLSYQLAALPALVVSVITPVFWPAFTHAWYGTRKKAMHMWMIRIVGVTAGLGALYAVGMVIFGDTILRYWTRGVVSSGSVLMGLLGLSVVMQCCAYWFQTFLWSTNSLFRLLVSNAITTIIIWAGCVVLTPTMGLTGVAISLCFASGLGALLISAIWALLELRKGASPCGVSARPDITKEQWAVEEQP